MKINISPIKAYLFVTLALIIPFVILFFLSTEQIKNMTREDGIIENLSAFFYFMASGICFLIFLRSSSEEKMFIFNTRRNYFFLLLALFFFFCFGEEISWGQRIFDIAPSDWLKTNNIQKETNLHNLAYYNPTDNFDGKVKIGIKQWLSPEGIFILFWIGFCLCIPAVNALSSKIKNFIQKIYFPILPIWIGILFFLNQLIFEIFKIIEVFPVHSVAEIKETNCALLFLFASTLLYADYKNNRNRAKT